MKHLLVPTDFTVESLQAIPFALSRCGQEEVSVVLLHLMEIPDGITDLLMLPRERPYLQLFTESYRNEVERIRTASNGQITRIFTDFLYVGIQRIFHDYVRRHEIDAIVCPANRPLSLATKISIDPTPFIQKAKVAVWNEPIPQHEGILRNMPTKQENSYRLAFG